MKRLHAAIAAILFALTPLCWAQHPTTPPPASVPQGAKFYCPMHCEGDKTYDQAGRCPVCKMKLKPVAAPVKLNLVLKSPADKLISGAPATVSLAVAAPQGVEDSKAKETAGAGITVIVVSRDLSWISTESAKARSDATMDLMLTFPHAGEFAVFADAPGPIPKWEFLPATLKVDGPTGAESPVAADELPATRAAAGNDVTLKSVGPIKASSKATVQFTVTRSGKPVQQPQTPSAAPQLIVVGQDLAWHALVQPAHAVGDGKATSPLTFEFTPPKAGFYALWLELPSEGEAVQARFVVQATP